MSLTLFSIIRVSSLDKVHFDYVEIKLTLYQLCFLIVVSKYSESLGVLMPVYHAFP